MYMVGKHVANNSGIVPGEVVALKDIRQSCHLIPLTGSNITWPSTWTSENVLDSSAFFLLNNWSSKFAYQMLW